MIIKGNWKIINKEGMYIRTLDSIDFIKKSGLNKVLENVSTDIDYLYDIYISIFISAMKRDRNYLLNYEGNKIKIDNKDFIPVLFQLGTLIGNYKYSDYHIRYLGFLQDKKKKVRVYDKDRKLSGFHKKRNVVELIEDYIISVRNYDYYRQQNLSIKVKTKLLSNKTDLTSQNSFNSNLNNQSKDLLKEYETKENIVSDLENPLLSIPYTEIDLFVYKENTEQAVILEENKTLMIQNQKIEKDFIVFVLDGILEALENNTVYKYSKIDEEEPYVYIQNEYLYNFILQLLLMYSYSLSEKEYNKYIKEIFKLS